MIFLIDLRQSFHIFMLPICRTDKMSEAAILEVVKKNFGDHLVLGEEGGIIGDTSSEYLWCIDPLGLFFSQYMDIGNNQTFTFL